MSYLAKWMPAPAACRDLNIKQGPVMVEVIRPATVVTADSGVCSWWVQVRYQNRDLIVPITSLDMVDGPMSKGWKGDGIDSDPST